MGREADSERDREVDTESQPPADNPIHGRYGRGRAQIATVYYIHKPGMFHGL